MKNKDLFTRYVCDGVSQDLSILDVEPSDLDQLSVVGPVIRDELQQGSDDSRVQCGTHLGDVGHRLGRVHLHHISSARSRHDGLPGSFPPGRSSFCRPGASGCSRSRPCRTRHHTGPRHRRTQYPRTWDFTRVKNDRDQK